MSIPTSLRSYIYRLLAPLLLVLLFALAACQAPTFLAPSAAPSTAVLLPGTPRLTLAPTPSSTLLAASPTLPPASPTPAPSPTLSPPQRVILISFDGLSPRAITAQNMPFLYSLSQAGAFAQNASTIMPSVTLPSHVSMLTGLCPSVHGVTWNDYRLGYPPVLDLFELAHNAGLKTAMLVGKYKLHQIVEPRFVDHFEIHYFGDKEILQSASELLSKEDFDLIFIHLPGGDDTGHVYGWDSAEQLAGFSATDALLQTFFAGVEQTYGANTTLWLFTADHGGHKYNHGTDKPEDIQIPWIVFGPGVLPGALSAAISTVDTAPTLAYALGLSIPDEWQGSPVFEVFGQVKQRVPTVCQ